MCVVRGPEIERMQNVVRLAAASASVCCSWARDRAKSERSGAGGGERQCLLCVGQRSSEGRTLWGWRSRVPVCVVCVCVPVI